MRTFALSTALFLALLATACAGSDGDDRRTGALEEKSQASVGNLTWRGAWDAGTEYAAGDLVAQRDGTWVAVEQSAGSDPAGCVAGEECPWDLLVAPSGVQGETGPQGPAGEKGERGATGPDGRAGPSGVSAYEIVSVTRHIGAQSDGFVSAQCPAGKKVLGGGFNSEGPTPLINGPLRRLVPSGFATSDDRWLLYAFNGDLFSGKDVRTFAICAVVSS